MSAVLDLENQFIKGVLENDFQVLEKIYSIYLPEVILFVKRNHGNLDDARDTFQEAIVVIFKKASAPNFELTTTFGGYLYGICRYIWLRQLKKKFRTEVTLTGDERYTVVENVEEELVELEKRQLFRQKLAEMGEDCRHLLRLFFEGIPLKEIAQKMGYTDDYVKKKNMLCKQTLASLVRNDRRYQELKTKEL